MKKLLIPLALLAALAGASSANAAMFGFSTENPNEFRLVSRQMPVQIWAPFVAFKHASEFNLVLAQARAFHRTPMISWETWDGVNHPTCATPRANCWSLRGMSNRDIARGMQDSYIRRQAKYIKQYGGTVYIRLDHEMNGYWYPWGRGAANDYVAMWRHVVGIFHKMGVRNAKFIWSPNPNTYQSDGAFDAVAKRYYPGRAYVDIVGTTLTRTILQGSFYSDPAWFFARADRLLNFASSYWITESLVDLQDMHHWMPLFRQEVDSRPWIKEVTWLSTIGKQTPSFGDMNWMLSDQPFARHYLTWRKGFRP
jgi:hypothetical protein